MRGGASNDHAKISRVQTADGGPSLPLAGLSGLERLDGGDRSSFSDQPSFTIV